MSPMGERFGLGQRTSWCGWLDGGSKLRLKARALMFVTLYPPIPMQAQGLVPIVEPGAQHWVDHPPALLCQDAGARLVRVATGQQGVLLHTVVSWLDFSLPNFPAGRFTYLAAPTVPAPAELLIDGDHSAAQFAEASTRVISRCVAHLWQKVGGRPAVMQSFLADKEQKPSHVLPHCLPRSRDTPPAPPCGSPTTKCAHSPHAPPTQNVALEATLLKPQMCIPGADYSGEKPTSVRAPLLCLHGALHSQRAVWRLDPPAE